MNKILPFRSRLPLSHDTVRLATKSDVNSDLDLTLTLILQGTQSKLVSTSGLNVELGAGHVIAIQVSFSQVSFQSQNHRDRQLAPARSDVTIKHDFVLP